LPSSSDQDTPSRRLEPPPVDLWSNERLAGSLYLAKSAKANPALSIAITQSSLRGHQKISRELKLELIKTLGGRRAKMGTTKEGMDGDRGESSPKILRRHLEQKTSAILFKK
jgi:hypothetical protein